MTDPVSGFTDELSLEQRTRLALVSSAAWLREAAKALEFANSPRLAAGVLEQADKAEAVLKEFYGER